MKVYAANISGMTMQQMEHLMQYVSSERLDRLSKYHFEQDRCRSLAGEILIRHLIAEELGMSNTEIEFNYNEQGKPLLKTDIEYHFNISHSGNWVVCVGGNMPVGIDVQELITKPEKLFRHCLTTSETKYLKQLQGSELCLAMTKIWCRKESYIKMIGQGLSMPMNQIEFNSELTKVILLDDIKQNMNYTDCYIKEPELDPDYCMSVCMVKNQNIEPIKITDEYLHWQMI